MSFFNSNIFAKEWLDIIFAGRNQSYGAYELRQLAPRATNIALGVVTSIVMVASAYAYIRQSKMDLMPVDTSKEVVLIEVDNSQIVEIDKIIVEPQQRTAEQPQQVAQDVPAQDLVKFTEVRAVNQAMADEEIVATDDVLDKKKLPANITMDGVKGGTLVPKGTFGKTKKEGRAIGVRDGSPIGAENGTDAPFSTVEIMPEPMGGMANFVRWVAENYNFPQSAIDNNAKGLIQVSFVVETDGSLSTFVVGKDMGYGTGTAAVSLLKKAKKWNPGVQNGRPVRVSFTLPIRLQVTQN